MVLLIVMIVRQLRTLLGGHKLENVPVFSILLMNQDQDEDGERRAKVW